MRKIAPFSLKKNCSRPDFLNWFQEQENLLLTPWSSPSWQAKGCSTTQVIQLLRKPNVYYHIHWLLSSDSLTLYILCIVGSILILFFHPILDRVIYVLHIFDLNFFLRIFHPIPCMLCVHHIHSNLIILISVKEYKLWNFSLCSFWSSCTFQFPFLLFSTLFSNTYKLNSSVSI